jgi:hypothetical protein
MARAFDCRSSIDATYFHCPIALNKPEQRVNIVSGLRLLEDTGKEEG